MENENNIEEYFDEMAENDQIFNSIIMKKQVLFLPLEVTSNVSDLFDLQTKFNQIKLLYNKLNLDNITLEETDDLLDQFKVLRKIIDIIKEDKSYNSSSDLVIKFNDYLKSILIKVQYLEDIDRRVFPGIGQGPYESRKKYVLVLDRNVNYKLMKFVKNNFILTPYDKLTPQNNFGKWIVDIFKILAFIFTKFSFNTFYLENDFILNNLLSIRDNFSKEIEIIGILTENNYFIENISEIQSKLMIFKKKILNSKKTNIKIHKWDGDKYGLDQMELIFSNF